MIQIPSTRYGATLRRASSLGFAIVMLALGFSKFLAPYRVTYALPEIVYYAASTMEIGIGLGVLLGAVRPFAWLAVGFFSLSILAAFSFDGNCGCFGGLAAESRQNRIVVAGIAGIWATSLAVSSADSVPLSQL